MGQFDLANRIKVNNPSADIDLMYGPYIDKPTALASVVSPLREKGRKVGIYNSEGKVEDWWWASGILDTDLELYINPNNLNYVKRTTENLPTLQITTPLYNWYTVVDVRGIAPSGFHIPLQSDWQTLSDYIGSDVDSLRTSYGWGIDISGTNTSGFSSIANGNRNGYSGDFLNRGIYASYWKPTNYQAPNNGDAVYIAVGSLNYYQQDLKNTGLSVRCIKDNNIPSVGDIVDASGNKYTEVVIGTQIWLVEDLKTTRYNNGDLILNVTSDATWVSLTTGAMCYYNNEAQSKFKHLVQTESGDVMLVDETSSASGNTEITVDNAAAYDDTAIYNKVGTVVTFSNPASLDPKYQTPQLYQLEVALVIAGTDPEESPYDAELLTGNWRFVGQSIQTVNDNTSKVYISGPNPLGQIKSITGYKHGDTVVFSDYNDVMWFNQYAVVGESYNPNTNTYVEVFVPYDWTEPQGGWVEQASTDRQRKFYADAADIRVNARNYPVGGDVVDLSTKNILRLTQTGAPFTDNGTTTIIPTYKLFDVACAFVKVSELGRNGPEVFAADITVSLSGGKTLGKYTNGQTIPAAGKTAEEVMRLISIEELFPTLTNPDNTFTLTQAGLREIGEVIPTLNFNATFNRGTISPAYGTSGFRAGLPEFYKYSGTSLPASVSSSSLSNAQTISNYIVLSGVQTWGNIVTSLIGEQPLTSADSNYNTPYAAGDTTNKTVSITGVYPWFGTSADIATLTKQALSLMNATYVGITVAGEDGVNKQKVQFPTGWSAITGIQFFNTNNSTWEWINSSKAASLLTFTQTADTQTIQGNVVNYTTFTHNGSTTGSRQLRFYTN